MSDALSLKDHLTLTNGWLRFAEAKNAALVALCGLLIPVFLGIITSSNAFAVSYSVLGLIFLAIALFTALTSFLPRLSRFRFLNINVDNNLSTEVVIYFGDISKLSLSEFTEKAKIVFEKSDWSILDKQILDQIHINSIIANRKYQMFSFAVWLLVAAIFTPVGLVALLILRKNDEI